MFRPREFHCLKWIIIDTANETRTYELLLPFPIVARVESVLFPFQRSKKVNLFSNSMNFFSLGNDRTLSDMGRIPLRLLDDE